MISVLSCPSAPCFFFKWEICISIHDEKRLIVATILYWKNSIILFVYGLWWSHEGLLMTAAGDHLHWELTDALQFLVEISVMNTGCTVTKGWYRTYSPYFIYLLLHSHTHMHMHTLTQFGAPERLIELTFPLKLNIWICLHLKQQIYDSSSKSRLTVGIWNEKIKEFIQSSVLYFLFVLAQQWATVFHWIMVVMVEMGSANPGTHHPAAINIQKAQQKVY